MNTNLVKILLCWEYRSFGRELSTHLGINPWHIMSRKGNSNNNNTSQIEIVRVLSTVSIIPRPSSAAISPLPSLAAIAPLPSA
jgi:hypothetical protein